MCVPQNQAFTYKYAYLKSSQITTIGCTAIPTRQQMLLMLLTAINQHDDILVYTNGTAYWRYVQFVCGGLGWNNVSLAGTMLAFSNDPGTL